MKFIRILIITLMILSIFPIFIFCVWLVTGDITDAWNLYTDLINL